MNLLSQVSRAFVCVIVAIWIAMPSSAATQSAATRITGTVTDESGGAVVGARITLVDERGAVRAHAVSDASGTFLLSRVASGKYVVQIESARFETTRSDVIVAEDGAPVALRVALKVAGVRETVDVAAPSAYVRDKAVSATKTDSPLSATPLNIQVVPQQVLQDQKVLILDQALTNVSGVKSQNYLGSTEFIWLRGFPSSSTFIDGFRLDEALVSGLRAMSNVDHIEVLKGPAAILYGRVEPGGMVNLVTRQPQATRSYSFEQLFGSWAHSYTNFDATGPITAGDTLLYRLNVSFDTSDSWRDGVHGKKFFIAPSLKWNISKKTEATVEVTYADNPLGGFDNGQNVPFVNGTLIALPRENNVAESLPLNFKTTLVKLDWSHRFNDAWTFRNQILSNTAKVDSPGYAAVLGFLPAGPSWLALRYMIGLKDTEAKTLATVFDLTGHVETGGLRHTLLVGADFYRFGAPATLSTSNLTVASVIDAVNPLHPGVPALTLDPTTQFSYDSTTNNYGVYAQDQLTLPHEVHLLAGLRYQNVSRTGWKAVGGATVADPAQSDSAVTPRVGVLWQAQRWLGAYGNYAGNFGANTGRDYQLNPLPPESARQYEAGAKTQFLDGRVQSTVAYFDLTKTNLATADPAHIGFQVATGEVRSKGLEFDLQGQIRPGWNVIATYTYTDIHVTKMNPGSSSGLIVGNQMADVPPNMGSLSTAYAFQDALKGWKVGAGVTARGETTDVTNRIPSPGYVLVDLMASREFVVGPSRMTAQLNVNNLLNKTYYLDAATSPYFLNWARLTYGAPRSVSVSLRVGF
ncbi:MAG TPA: TonB-dependent receptor [Vicinamibacterales bacterium]